MQRKSLSGPLRVAAVIIVGAALVADPAGARAGTGAGAEVGAGVGVEAGAGVGAGFGTGTGTGPTVLEQGLARCAPKGTSTADANLARTLNGQLGATMAGRLDAYRIRCARRVVQAVQTRGLHRLAATIAITTSIVETGIRNIGAEGGYDGLGLFQHRVFRGTPERALDPVRATNAFLDRMLSGYPDGAWQSVDIGVVCQAVQLSAYPERYQPEAADARIIVDALWVTPAHDDYPSSL